ncbi:MAG: AbrB/MazE/SpoVT family DNA-binding domain-containing protein [Egibacteraceae bacterium]
MNSVVSEKGQVTIPKALRDRLGIKPGEVLEFSEDHGRLVVVRVRRQDPTDRVYGLLQLDRGTDELIDELRGQADVA